MVVSLTNLPTGHKVHIGTMSAMIELLYFPPDEVFEYLPIPQLVHDHDATSHVVPSGQASVGSIVGSEVGAQVRTLGSVSQQAVPRSLPAATSQLATPTESVSTWVGTSAQSLFESSLK